ncbi:MAG TPA: murein biosynthesis integral membrane protein MurJ [bacterium]|nr:murein biosynthesis integral membrane protein MurJ [bacterium]
MHEAPAGDARTDAHFTRRVGAFSVGTLLSRILGVVRESVFAYLFGAGFATDAFNVAFRIPNMLRDLFAESALSAAFVPTFVRSLHEGDRRRSWAFASNMFNTVALITGALSVLGIIFAPAVVKVIALGFSHDPAKMHLTMVLTRVMFPFLLFIAIAAWAMGILNACGTFFMPAAAPAAFNVFSALIPLAAYGFLKARGIEPILGMAWGVTIGAVAQYFIQVPSLRRHGYRWTPVMDVRSPELRQVFRRWVPMVLGFATWQINFMVNTFLLAFLPQGSVTWVNYAYRIQHLPAGLFGTAVESVSVAEFSHQMARADVPRLKSRFRHSMALISVLTLPAAILLIALAVPVTRLIYQHGRFTPHDTTLTAQALALYCLGIWAAGATNIVAAGFYSTGDTRTPAFTGMSVVAANIAINLVLMRYLGFRSFPLAASFTQLVNFIILYAILRRRTGGLEGRYIAGITVRTLAAALLAGAVTFGCARGIGHYLPTRRILYQVVQVLVSGGVGVLVYYGLALLFRVHEVKQAAKDFLGPLLRRGR